VPAVGAAGGSAATIETVGRRPSFEWGGRGTVGGQAQRVCARPAWRSGRPERPGHTARQSSRGLAVVLGLAAELACQQRCRRAGLTG